jgi:hypothetical protein
VCCQRVVAAPSPGHKVPGTPCSLTHVALWWADPGYVAAHCLSIPPIKTLAAPVEPSPWGMGTVVIVPMLLS